MSLNLVPPTPDPFAIEIEELPGGKLKITTDADDWFLIALAPHALYGEARTRRKELCAKIGNAARAIRAMRATQKLEAYRRDKE